MACDCGPEITGVACDCVSVRSLAVACDCVSVRSLITSVACDCVSVSSPVWPVIVFQ